MKSWETTGLLKFYDKNSDGRIEYYNDKSAGFEATAAERGWKGNELTVNNVYLGIGSTLNRQPALLAIFG